MVAAVAMVKDELDIIEAVLYRMAREVDFLIVSDNGSTDGTRELLESLESDLELIVLDDPEPGYYQSEKVSRLAEVAHDRGAEWVIPFDADERWYSPFGRIADVLADRSEAIATATLYNHVPTAQDPAVDDPIARTEWRRREPGVLPKVACRPRPRVRIYQGNHGADYGGTVDGLLVVRHFPYRSVEQFERKVRNGAAAYAATDLPEDHGKHWRDYGQLLESGGPGALGDVFRAWFWSQDPSGDATLICDPCP